MFSFNRWILRNPFWIQCLYFFTILSFFTESSFNEDRLYLEALLILVLYGLCYRFLLKLIAYDIRKKNIDLRNRWEKVLFLSSTWIFFLLPFKFIIMEPMRLWVYDVSRWKFLIFFLVMVFIFYSSIQYLNQNYKRLNGKENMSINGILVWSIIKNFFLIFILPLGVLLFIPFLLVSLFYL